MSADTHTSTPRHGAHTTAAGVDERYAGNSYEMARRGRLATVADEHSAPPVPTGSGALTWDQDSAAVPVVPAPQPRLRQMLGVCGWAAVLGAIGLVVGIRGFYADLMDATPNWYEPMMIGVGLTGIALTVGAFISVQRRRTPYILLSAATLVLAYAIFLTAQAI